MIRRCRERGSERTVEPSIQRSVAHVSEGCHPATFGEFLGSPAFAMMPNTRFFWPPDRAKRA